MEAEQLVTSSFMGRWEAPRLKVVPPAGSKVDFLFHKMNDRS